MKIKGIIETVIYVDDLDTAEDFYGRVLGLRVGEVLPPHGAKGPGHFALGIEVGELDAWRTLLQSHGVTIQKEV
jgi:catechol 2,3-dioxygenase-like lactoylglutathione lyase family enzyme